MRSIEFNEQFDEALRLMGETDHSLFITGKAGTGKSTLLAHFCENTEKNLVVLAPTGVAALNVKGQTIHSFFNFYVDVTPQKIRDKKSKPRNARLYKKLQTIIIDEISMVRADLLDCIDVFLRMYGPHAMQPFGGVQMIFIGDLYQLPPVVLTHEREIFASHYETPYFFSAEALQNFPFQRIELQKVYRQKDQKFVTLLNKIRNNSVSNDDVEFLNTRHTKTQAVQTEGFFITLTTTNQRADEINETHVQGLKGKIHHAKAEIKGDFTKEYFPTSPDLKYKIDSQVMMLNNDSAKRWVNGSLGIIQAVRTDDKGNEYLRIRLQDKAGIVDVYPFEWEVFRFGVEDQTVISETAGTFKQYPFRLAWAITIHKSQGKTFDHVTIDIGSGAFASGQIYVALSRCTSFEGIFLKTRIGKHNIKTDKRIHAFLLGDGVRESDDERTKKLDLIKNAITCQEYLDIIYLTGREEKTTRTIRPLTVGSERHKGMDFLGMKAFCTLRQEERVFSLDRIIEIKKSSAGS